WRDLGLSLTSAPVAPAVCTFRVKPKHEMHYPASSVEKAEHASCSLGAVIVARRAHKFSLWYAVVHCACWMLSRGSQWHKKSVVLRKRRPGKVDCDMPSAGDLVLTRCTCHQVTSVRIPPSCARAKSLLGESV